MKIATGIWALFVGATIAITPVPAAAWGDEGHQIVAMVAETVLYPGERTKVGEILAADPENAAAPGLVGAATWADRYRDSDRNGSRQRYEQTRQWHFVDIELSDPNLDRACFGRPPLSAGTLASNGPAQACVVDKINQFAAELGNRATPPEERLLALKFLIHFVGDLHQPLHASDDHDAGGNRKNVVASGFRPGTLHHFWDTELVAQLGADYRSAAAAIMADITPHQRAAWSHGTPADWALESFDLAHDHAYGKLGRPGERGVYTLDSEYVDLAVKDVRLQLGKAGVRLGMLLHQALGR